ncbi:MAG: relaxase/mobilization nuclease domain-containing protein [Gemmatimonadaceae bacterium]
MIGVSSSSRSFASLGKYLVIGRDKVEEGRVAWTSARNLPTDDPEVAAKIMRATAAQNVRVSQPVYHLALSFDPRDAVDRAAMERVANRVLGELKLQEHQAIIVAHADRAHPHLHILINRVHPETGRVWDRWQDYPTIQRALREEERALGLRQVERHSGQLLERHSKETQRSRETTRIDGGVAQSDGPRREADPRLTAIERDLETYERVSELSQQRYCAERDVAASAARREQVEATLERIGRADRALDTALVRAYRDPVAAKQAFLAVAEHIGEREAVRQMRDAPERYGQLITTDQRRGNIGRPETVEAAARTAAREAAGYGAELVSARREIAKLVASQGREGARALPVDAIAVIRERAVDAVGSARARLETFREAERALPTREQFEFRLVQGLRRLSPPEVEKLRSVLSPQRLTLVYKLRQMVRDAAMGRDDEQ